MSDVAIVSAFQAASEVRNGGNGGLVILTVTYIYMTSTPRLLSSPYLFFLRIKNPFKPSTAVRSLCNISPPPNRIMAYRSHPDSAKEGDPNGENKTVNYPIPLSPPLPAISKQMELARAMSASSKSSLFSLSLSDVLFEDEWLIVVNKPQGIYCESVLASVPRLWSNSTDSSTLRNESNPLELHLANRLDRDTSGVMVITKSHKIAGKLVKAFTDHKVSKTYVVLCIGAAPKWETISIKSGHGRSKFGAWRVYAASDVGRTLPGGSVVRDMATSFEVLSVNGQGNFREPTKHTISEEEFQLVEERGVSLSNDDKKDEMLIRAYPKNGRTHQIRLHCQYLRIPIRGDVKYEGVYEWRGQMFDGHALHAESLSFSHPVTGLPVEVKAPLPLWAEQAFTADARASQ
ncbi:PREDICTED: RNA pseudouridine synthase 1 [Nelumbo nucifera]|uniref:RNA pseudouridine synthase 1 n=2 Tax=Nelumbo nucifera TaxID=4432 RepID=A0A1U8AB57_NELNU|nr:PREDICTED: RNA pseudouridine synthase 1 [Nelumbo nucifera]DAD38243.1 TPA_asm: hypothetical protein HUJ06_008884 [Nelumbo nucifera]